MSDATIPLFIYSSHPTVLVKLRYSQKIDPNIFSQEFFCSLLDGLQPSNIYLVKHVGCDFIVYSQGTVIIECSTQETAIRLYSLCKEHRLLINGCYELHPSYVRKPEMSVSKNYPDVVAISGIVLK